MAQESAAGGEDIASQHIVQLFDTTQSLVDIVSGFVSNGLVDGDAVLVVMRLPHWNAIASSLPTPYLSLSDAIASGQLTVLDASRTLSRIMWHGSPMRSLFEEVVAKTVRDIRARGVRLRVYSEMVDILAEERNFHAACGLEHLWSQLVAAERLTVVCGYSTRSFVHADGMEALQRIRGTHHTTRIIQNPGAGGGDDDRSPHDFQRKTI